MIDQQAQLSRGSIQLGGGQPMARCRELTLRISQLEREITQVISRLAPTLLTLLGCGGLSAAKIVGETAGGGRFRSKAAFARWNGTAPIPVWSGNATKFRLNRGGNRQVNAAVHQIAIKQCRVGAVGRPTPGPNGLW